MSLAARAAAVSLLAAAAAPATAFVRTNTCPNDPNAGYALWWGGSPPVLSYELSSAHVPVGCGSDFATLQALVNASVATWSQAGGASPCTGLSVNAGVTGSILVGVQDGHDVIVFRSKTCTEPGAVPAGDPCLTRGGCGNLYDCWEDGADTRTLAVTVVTFDTGSGRIVDADMELWDWNGSTSSPTGHYLTCAPPGAQACTGTVYGKQGCIAWDVGSVVTHEAGHMIGLDHETAVPSVMAPTLGSGSTAQRVLFADDIDAVCSIYPPGQPAVQQKLPGSCTGSSRQGCGCGEGSAGLPLLFLLPFLARRRGPGPRAPGSESPSPIA